MIKNSLHHADYISQRSQIQTEYLNSCMEMLQSTIPTSSGYKSIMCTCMSVHTNEYLLEDTLQLARNIIPSSCTSCQQVQLVSTSDMKYRFGVLSKVLAKHFAL